MRGENGSPTVARCQVSGTNLLNFVGGQSVWALSFCLKLLDS